MYEATRIVNHKSVIALPGQVYILSLRTFAATHHCADLKCHSIVYKGIPMLTELHHLYTIWCNHRLSSTVSPSTVSSSLESSTYSIVTTVERNNRYRTSNALSHVHATAATNKFTVATNKLNTKTTKKNLAYKIVSTATNKLSTKTTTK